MERDKAGEETTDPAGPGGLPDLGYGSRFQAGYFLSPTGRWDGVGGAVIVVQASGRALGPHWFRCCTGTVWLLRGSRWDLRAS